MPISNKLNAILIGTKMNKKTGKMLSKNCKGQEKIKRLEKVINKYEIQEFYSDSQSDKFLAAIAKNSFKVKKIILQNGIKFI